ncbi:MAG: lysophospholipid acyltransferase family protein [Acetobacteraceae bacterium]|nr:lysophospholipid acyltransferase family protein [Acetobacteraceae bacterium]
MTEADRVMAARSAYVFALFARYARRYVARHFHAVRLANNNRPDLRGVGPVIVCATHAAWWDPLIFVLLHHALFSGRRGFGVMEQQALGRYGFMQRLGVFGIEPDAARGARRFLAVANGILRAPDNVLWVTAQGRFTDPRVRPITLRAGVAHLAKRSGSGLVLPLAVEYPFWNERPPQVLLRFGSPLAFDAATRVDGWNARLGAALEATADALAADACTRDPSRFETLIAGRTGIGGVYDGWRRAKAWASGRKAALAHEETR